MILYKESGLTHSDNAKHDHDAFHGLSFTSTARLGASLELTPTLLSAAKCIQTFERHRHADNIAVCSKVSSGTLEAQSLLQTTSGCTPPTHSIYDKHICRSDSQRICLTLICNTSSRQPLSLFLVEKERCYGQIS